MFLTKLHLSVSPARLAAFGLVVLLFVSGCSGSEASLGAPTSSASASNWSTAESSPTPTPAISRAATSARPSENVPLPVLPELAEQQSKEGLLAFTEYWYALATYAFETGDLSPLQEVSGPDCAICSRLYEMVELGYEDQDWIVGGNFTVGSKHSAYVLTSKDVYQVLAIVSQFHIQYRGPDNHLYEIEEGWTDTHMLEASYADGKWTAQDVVWFKAAGSEAPVLGNTG